jgi:predicted HicB family RNase H-like nuclease
MEGRLTLRIPLQLHQQAQEKARTKRVSLSQAIRWFLERWVRGEIEAVPPQD